MVNPGTAITSNGSSCRIVVPVILDIWVLTDASKDCINDIAIEYTYSLHLLFDIAHATFHISGQDHDTPNTGR